jgi:hypothetical protein
MRTRLLGLPAICLAVAGFIAAPAEAEPLELSSRARQLNPDAPKQHRVGRLAWRGGLLITSPDDRWGGLSGLEVSPDGKRMVAVSDRGHWVTAELAYDRAGRLSGIGNARIGELPGKNGKPLKDKKRRDAEALAALDGRLLVAFERKHRIWRYPAAAEPFALAPDSLAKPPGLKDAPNNHGAEALTALADGGILAITQDDGEDGDFAAYLQRRGKWSRLRYRAGAGDFEPTGAALLPDGDVVVLERHFNWLGGLAARLVRLAAAEIGPDRLLLGREIARLRPPLTLDNMEGVAARRGPRGETLIYLISDDNFSLLQDTLLLMFELEK